MIIDFRKLSIRDLEGKEYISSEVLKTFGHLLWRNAETIEQDNFARAIYDGASFEATSKELSEFIPFVDHTLKKVEIQAFIRKGIVNFLTTIKNNI